MKKIKGRPHYYRNSKGYIYYVKNFTLPNGKYKQLNAKNPSDWENKKLALIEEFYNSDKLISKEYSKATFKDMTEPFLQDSETYKVQTYIRRKRYWNNYILPHFKTDVVSKMKSEDIDLFYRVAQAERGSGHVLEIHNVLNAFFNWNIENDYCIKSNPISRGTIKRIKRMGRLEKIERLSSKSLKDIQGETLSLEEVKYILREVRDTPQEIIYQLQIMHGLRISEALGMTYENIDFKNNYVHVRQQSQGVTKSQLVGTKFEKDSYTDIRSLKTEESMRTIPLQPATREVLLRDGENKGFVYTNMNGTVCNHNNWTKRHFKPLVGNLGLKISNTHALRGFFASHHFDMGTNPVLIQRMMGHKDLQTTMKHYTKPIIETVEKNRYMMSELAV